MSCYFSLNRHPPPSQILDGYMLSQWKARAQDVKQHGWYWEYTLVGLKIDSVVMAEGNTKAVVQATLQEAAQVRGLTVRALTRVVETALPSHSPHGHMILRGDLMGLPQR